VREVRGRDVGPDDLSGIEAVVTPSHDGLVHKAHGGIPADNSRLDLWARGAARLYIDQGDARYDVRGHRLEHTAAGWRGRDCHWTARMKRDAVAGEVTELGIALMGRRYDRDDHPAPPCDNPVAIRRRVQGARRPRSQPRRDPRSDARVRPTLPRPAEQRRGAVRLGQPRRPGVDHHRKYRVVHGVAVHRRLVRYRPPDPARLRPDRAVSRLLAPYRRPDPPVRGLGAARSRTMTTPWSFS